MPIKSVNSKKLNLLQVLKMEFDELHSLGLVDLNEDSGYIDAFISFVSNRFDLETKVDEDEDDNGLQSLDFENFGFSKVEPDEIIFSAGGDWQEPLQVTLRLNDQEEIVIVKQEYEFRDDYKIKFHEIMRNI
jgi:hypothetical protein